MASPTCVEMVWILPPGLAITRFSHLKAKKQYLMFTPVNCQQVLRSSLELRVKSSCCCSFQSSGGWPSRKLWLRAGAAGNRESVLSCQRDSPWDLGLQQGLPTEGVKPTCSPDCTFWPYVAFWSGQQSKMTYLSKLRKILQGPEVLTSI